MQDGYIFNDNIAKNIAVSDEVPDYNALLHACKVANILSFVESLPLGFNTKIGAEGNGISAGQKQRILIARAVYKNPQYIFFDEATNALDANNEKTILENLNEFFKDKTVVVVAHRLSTVKNADNIIVLDNGEITEQGTHEELAMKRGEYYQLVKNQLELGS
jgi:ATP-binding cassette, subfamily B, bacterial